MVIERYRHEFNGKLVGHWYKWPDGRMMYLAQCSGMARKNTDTKTNSWCLDKMTLRTAESKNCTWIGFVHRLNGARLFYVTHISDFWNSPYSGDVFRDAGPMRRLAKNKFRIHPGNTEEAICKSIRLR